jgi:hypothetical protein
VLVTVWLETSVVDAKVVVVALMVDVVEELDVAVTLLFVADVDVTLVLVPLVVDNVSVVLVIVAVDISVEDWRVTVEVTVSVVLVIDMVDTYVVVIHLSSSSSPSACESTSLRIRGLMKSVVVNRDESVPLPPRCCSLTAVATRSVPTESGTSKELAPTMFEKLGAIPCTAAS